MQDWKEGCERCKQILRYGGMGHTLAIHSRNDEVILQFGLQKPASRIVVNTPTTLGSIGLTTSLDPAMTLGCGGWGGNITSDNISPRHLLNIKRLAYETHPFAVPRRPAGGVNGRRARCRRPAARPRMPGGIPAASLARRIDDFLAVSRLRAGRAASSRAGRTSAGTRPQWRPKRRTSHPDQRVSKNRQNSCAKTTCGRP